MSQIRPTGSNRRDVGRDGRVFVWTAAATGMMMVAMVNGKVYDTLSDKKRGFVTVMMMMALLQWNIARNSWSDGLLR